MESKRYKNYQFVYCNQRHEIFFLQFWKKIYGDSVSNLIFSFKKTKFQNRNHNFFVFTGKLYWELLVSLCSFYELFTAYIFFVILFHRFQLYCLEIFLIFLIVDLCRIFLLIFLKNFCIFRWFRTKIMRWS